MLGRRPTNRGDGSGTATRIVGTEGLSALGNEVRGNRGEDRRSRRCLGLCLAFPRSARAGRGGRSRGGSVAAAGSRSPWKKAPGGSSRPNGEKPSGKNPTDVASDVGRLFSPHSQGLGIAPDDTASPVVLRKMVYAGSQVELVIAALGERQKILGPPETNDPAESPRTADHQQSH